MPIAFPLTALAIAVAFLALHARSRRRFVLVTAILWGGYAIYEELMRRRILCTGECNIRVDLVLLYPVLALLSIAALVVGFRKRST